MSELIARGIFALLQTPEQPFPLALRNLRNEAIRTWPMNWLELRELGAVIATALAQHAAESEGHF